MTYKEELYIIELPKIKGKEQEDKEDEMLDWLIFLENPNSGRVKEKMKENEELREAKEKLEEINEDEKMQRIAELRLKAIMDEKAIYAKGVDDGIERGIEQGIEIGILERNIEIVKKMLEENASIEFIGKVTGLTKEEIEEKENEL